MHQKLTPIKDPPSELAETFWQEVIEFLKMQKWQENSSTSINTDSLISYTMNTLLC